MNPTAPVPAVARPLVAALACLVCLPTAAVAEVRLNGLTEAQEQNVRALVPLADTSCDANRWRVERLFQDADQDIREALQALGFYRIDIRSRLDWTDDCWVADFEIVPGQPVRYGDVAILIDGEPLSLAESDLLNATRPVPGKVFHHGEYEQFKAGLMRRAGAEGYFDARFDVRQVVVDPPTGIADVTLHLDRGPRYRFGEVEFTEGILTDQLLRRFTEIREGDFYSADAVNELYNALNGSGYFSRVAVNTDPIDEDNLSVPVDVILTPGIRRNYSIGAGFATDTGPQGRVGYINRRRNDRGHQFEARGFISDINSEATASYRWPVHDPRTDWASFVTGIQHEDTDTSENDTFKFGYLRTRSLTDNWIWTRSVDYAYENYSIGDQDESSELIIFGVNFESAIGREISRSTRGRRLNLDIRGASDALGSDTSFLQVKATAKWLWSLSPKNRVIVRGKLGTTIKDDLQELPVSVRFFTGGDRSVRGYDFESLGPTNMSGEVIGGSHVAEASIEFDRMLTDKWSIAAFADTGSAFNDSNPEFSSGVGLGIRWYSPVGPLRLDIAHPLDDSNRDFRIHIVLGPDL